MPEIKTGVGHLQAAAVRGWVHYRSPGAVLKPRRAAKGLEGRVLEEGVGGPVGEGALGAHHLAVHPPGILHGVARGVDQVLEAPRRRVHPGHFIRLAGDRAGLAGKPPPGVVYFGEQEFGAAIYVLTPVHITPYYSRGGSISPIKPWLHFGDHGCLH